MLSRTYQLHRWLDWDTELDSFVQDFLAQFGEVPQALLANTPTFVRIDMAAKRSHVRNLDGEHPDESVYAPIAGFCGEGYALEFYVDETLHDACVELVFDERLDGGDDDGEPVPADARAAS